MATVPTPEPDYGPVDSPVPESAPTELPPMPDDVDMPAAVDEPISVPPGQQAGG